MITWRDYFNGRDTAFAQDLTLEISRNAQRTIEVVNAVLEAMAADGVDLAGVHVASGWRPPAVNDRTANAAHAGVRAIERPQWTPSWLHVQTCAPASGRFIFIPSSAAPLVAHVLPGELDMPRLT